VPRLLDLVTAVPVNLAVSLHATTDTVRDVLVPLNRRFPLRELLGALKALPGLSRRRPIFFEYTLMEGVNDSLEDAERLVKLLAEIPSKINLIPMNAHPDAPYRPPSPEVADRFLGVLSRARMVSTLRRPRGTDIAAACGQLALREARA
jgi:23S rRNA (adenine2503-C2)-methyltransferase